MAVLPSATVITHSTSLPVHSSTIDNVTIPQSSSPCLWRDLFFKENFNPPSHPPPSYLEDGTPLVKAPPHIILKSSELWKDHLLCTFFGDPPSPVKIYADLNPIWGRGGNISVRNFTEGSCLIFIPSASTRKWVANIAFWSAGLVSFCAVMWSPTASLQSRVLKTAPIWISLHEVPPQLWSKPAVETIATGIGTLIPSSHPIFPPSNLGSAKIRIILNLEKKLPPLVAVADEEGNIVKIRVEYKLPPRCSGCSCFGHSEHRCPSRRQSHQVKTSNATVQDGVTTKQFVQDEVPNPNSFQSLPNMDQPIKNLPEAHLPQQPKSKSVQLDASVGSQASQNPVNIPQDGPQLNFEPNSPTNHLTNPTLVTTKSPHTNNDSSPPTSTHHQNQQPSSPPLPSTSLSSQIPSGITADMATPRPTPNTNSHIYFSTPSSSSINTSSDSPLSIANFKDHNHETEESKRTKVGMKKKTPIQIEVDDDITQLLNSPDWQNGYHYSRVKKDRIGKTEAT